MPLSIKNPLAERLAKELAKESGTSITVSVIDALEQALRRVRGRRTAILDVSDRCAVLPDLDTRSAERDSGLRRARGLLLMVLDSSALLAILFKKSERDAFATAIAGAGTRLVSSVKSARKGPSGVRELDLLLITPRSRSSRSPRPISGARARPGSGMARAGTSPA